MREERAEKGVMHCFSEDWETAKAALDLGFYISFSGPIQTHKNSSTDSVLACANKLSILPPKAVKSTLSK
jgi:Tat protein secretion system quality control protein TatD with DNase activity